MTLRAFSTPPSARCEPSDNPQPIGHDVTGSTSALDSHGSAIDLESRIRPFRVNECQECHGSTQQKSGLRLNSSEALRKGGDSGLIVFPDPRTALSNASPLSNQSLPTWDATVEMRHGGRDFRLTDVHGHPIRAMLA